MKTPPSLAPGELEAGLEASYGLQPLGLRFLPRGECSWGYQVTETGGPGYFLKLYRTEPPPEWAARLVYRLHEEAGLEEISAPLPDRDGFMTTRLAGYPASLFRWIKGPTLQTIKERSEPLFRLGQTLARLHACRALQAACQRIENFELVGEANYRQVLAFLADGLYKASGPAGAALDLLLPLRDRLPILLEMLLKAQARARLRALPLVICHGDPTPGNVLVTAGGRAHLIDWDDLILAPRERDLVFWADEAVFDEGRSFHPVLDGYASLAGPVSLDPGMIDFYRRQWAVGEIGAFAGRLLFEDPEDTQAESDLANLKEELKWV